MQFLSDRTIDSLHILPQNVIHFRQYRDIDTFALLMNIEKENTLFCLQFEADRRAIIITINSFGTELSKDDRAKLYPRCGKLNPDGLAALARAEDYEQVKAVAEYYAEYSKLFEGAGNNPGDKTLEDKFFEHEVNRKALF